MKRNKKSEEYLAKPNHYHPLIAHKNTYFPLSNKQKVNKYFNKNLHANILLSYILFRVLFLHRFIIFS